MAFQKLNVPKKFYQYKNVNAGDVLCEGTYIKVGEDKFGGKTHEFRDAEEDAIHVLNSSGHLNYLMREHAQFGDYCRVTYKGKTTLPDTSKFAGKESHTFDLEIDPDRSVKAATPTFTELDHTDSASDDAADLEDETL
jgi:hypothetical protein